MQSGLVVVKRYRAERIDSVTVGALLRVPSLEIDPAQVLSRYRGIDGHPWPPELLEPGVVEGFAPLSRLKAIRARLRSLGTTGYELLYCVALRESGELGPVPAGFEQLGIDYGFYRGEDEAYSVLLQEIALGLLPEMRDLAHLLNRHLLLPGVAAVDVVSSVRRRLVARKADLENAEGESPTAFLLCSDVYARSVGA